MWSERIIYIKSFMKKSVAYVLILSFVISVFRYCGQDAVAAGKPKLPKKKINLYVGESYKFNVKGCTWKSSKKKIATVSKKGKLKAKKAGNVKITATSKKNGKKAVCNIKVGKFANAMTLVSASTVVLKPGQNSHIKVNVMPLDVLYNDVVYTSSDTSIANVSKKGVITPVSNGIVTISVMTKAVTSKGKKLTLQINVIVIGYNDNSNNTDNGSTEQVVEKPDLSQDLGDYTTVVVPPTGFPSATPKPSEVPGMTSAPQTTDGPGVTKEPESTQMPNTTMTPQPHYTPGPTQEPGNPSKTIQDYIDEFVVNPDSPLVDTLVVSNNDGSMKTLYFLNKEYSGMARIVVDGYSYSDNTNVSAFLDILESEYGGVVNNAETVKVYRRKKTDSWSITLLKTDPQIIYYLSALKNDTKFNSPYGLIIADGNTIGHISVTK